MHMAAMKNGATPNKKMHQGYGPPVPPGPSKPSIPPAPMPKQPIAPNPMSHLDVSLMRYAVKGLQLSAKACLEDKGEMCGLLQRGCEAAASDTTPDEQMFCQALTSICPVKLAGVELSGSLCVQKSVPICEAASQLCAAMPDPGQRAACMQTYQAMCPHASLP